MGNFGTALFEAHGDLGGAVAIPGPLPFAGHEAGGPDDRAGRLCVIGQVAPILAFAIGDVDDVVIGATSDQLAIVGVAIGRIGRERELALIDDLEPEPFGRSPERRGERRVARMRADQHQDAVPVSRAQQLHHGVRGHAIGGGCV
jgi:hypothetical protein